MHLGCYLGLRSKKQKTAEKQNSKEAKKQKSREAGKGRKAEKQRSRGNKSTKKMPKTEKKIAFLLPSGKHTKNYGKSPCYSWENPLFLWPFSMAVFSTLSVGQDTSG